MALTGDARSHGLVAPAGIVRRIAAIGEALGVDGLALLAERAAIAGFGRRGAVSCGGATRLVPAADGWVAVSLARPDDVELLAAWFERDRPVGPDAWSAVHDELAQRPAREAVARGRMLGLPVARLSEAAGAHRGAVMARRLGGAPPRPVDDGPLVVDLSSLWAGPLCAHLLGRRGARVVKVESVQRPDGARRGPPAFYDLLHAGHRSVALDLTTAAGRSSLRLLVAAADVVVEASRPRALAQLGVDALDAVAAGPQLWVSITGHGREGEAGDAVAFGDDAAVAGGLVAWAADGAPRFVADAVADPLTGMAAAAAAVETLGTGGRWLLDVSMVHVAADVAVQGADPAPGGPAGCSAAVAASGTLQGSAAAAGASPRAEPWAEGRAGEGAAPRARRATGRAPALGADTAALLAELAERGST